MTSGTLLRRIGGAAEGTSAFEQSASFAIARGSCFLSQIAAVSLNERVDHIAVACRNKGPSQLFGSAGNVVENEAIVAAGRGPAGNCDLSRFQVGPLKVVPGQGSRPRTTRGISLYDPDSNIAGWPGWTGGWQRAATIWRRR